MRPWAGTIPVFAHVPLILGPDGTKLSKRDGALGLETFRAMGYLPAGLRNYLARLGWSHGDDEIFTTEQMIEWFDIDDINKSPGRLDFAKLNDVNSHYIRQASDAELMRRIREFLPEAEGGPELVAKLGNVGWDKLAAGLPSLKGRAKTLKELVDGAAYLFAERPIALEEKAAQAAGCGRPRGARQVAPAARSNRRLAGAGAGGGRARLWRSDGPEARQGGPAAARRADWQIGVAPGLRRDGRAGARGGTGPHPRPGAIGPKLRAGKGPQRRSAFALGISCRSAKCIIVRCAA